MRDYDDVILDGSINIPKKKIISSVKDDHGYYTILKLDSEKLLPQIEGYFPKNLKIKKAEGSRGLKITEYKYKVFWKYINFDGFYFSDNNSGIPIYQQYCIASNFKKETLFLFAICNSSLIKIILEGLLKIEEERKLSFLLGLTSFKEFIRIPKINSKNKHLKKKIIELIEQMLELEKNTVGDQIRIDTLMQKFDEIYVEGNKLILKRGKTEIKASIKAGQEKLVKKVINGRFKDISYKQKSISLSELKELPSFDKDKQMKLKDEIDRLVYQLYRLAKKEIGLIEAKDAENEFLNFKAKFQKLESKEEKGKYSKSLSLRDRKIIWKGLREYRKNYPFTKEDELIKEISVFVKE